MDRRLLLHALARVQTDRDAGPVLLALGYQVASPAPRGSLVIGRWLGFEVVGSYSRNPQATARDLAAQLARTSRRGMAIAWGPQELAAAAPRLSGPGVTPALLVQLAEPEPLALQLLEDLAPRPGTTALAHALHVAEVLSSERAGERFFQRFRTVLERFTEALPRGEGPAARRTVALIALTRVLFLYFVQAKGWLDGRTDYLRCLLDDTLARGRHFHRDVLQPLFFGTLNRPPSQRSGRLRLGRIPYLNGGLFEPHPLERRTRAPWLPNALWREAFDQVFERFRFCVREADEVSAVSPDMLGRVFERVMDDGERHATGTFYTPEAVVRQIVDAAIETALTGSFGLSPAATRRILAGTVTRPAEARAAEEALCRLRLLDPAAGSGAFLLGALERLTELRSALVNPRSPAQRCQLRRAILRDNLFGVDLNPIAVRLAELRLWLALVADDPTRDIAAISPLPNLDGVVRQGDVLLDPLSAARALGAPLSPPPTLEAPTIAALRQDFFQAGPQHRRDLARRLREAEVSLATHLLEQARASTDAALRDLAAAARGRDLFGHRTGFRPLQRRRYRALRAQRLALRAAQRALARGTVPFFSFEVHAPEIALGRGFDIVLGNPPWVRAERLPPPLRRALSRRYGWWQPAASRGFHHLPDLAVAFLERSLELVRPGGTVALLLPSKLATAGYAELARGRLVRETTITYVHRVPDRQAARFGATTYPLALVCRKEAPPPQHAIRLGFESPEAVPQHTLEATGPWVLAPDRLRDAIRQFLAAGTPLERLAPPLLGVKTGADRCFLGYLRQAGKTTGLLVLDGGMHEMELALLRPAVRGRDVRPFCAHSPSVIVWPYANGTALSSLPPHAAAYFAARRARLEHRADYHGGPPWTLFRLGAALPGWRVVWPDIAQRPVAAVLEASDLPDAVPLNTCYVARAPDRNTALAIAAVFNSTWARAAVWALADEARGGYRRLNARIAGQLPVPGESGCAALAGLSAAAHHHRHADQDALDQAVADALSLSQTHRDWLRQWAAHQR